MLTGTMGFNAYGTAVTYDLTGQNAYIEITGAIPGTTNSIYQSYVFTYYSNGSSIVSKVAGPSNSPNTVIAISPTVINNNSTVSFQLSQTVIADPLPTFVVQITAFPQVQA